MPWLSKAQARWGNSPAGLKALGGKSSVKEWNDVTDFSKLPEKIKAENSNKQPKQKTQAPVKIHHPGLMNNIISKHKIKKANNGSW